MAAATGEVFLGGGDEWRLHTSGFHIDDCVVEADYMKYTRSEAGFRVA